MKRILKNRFRLWGFLLSTVFVLSPKAYGENWVEGYLSVKKNESVLYLNPFSQSQIRVLLVNDSAVKAKLKKTDFVGPAAVRLKVIKAPTTKLGAQAKLIEVKVRSASDLRGLATYDQKLKVVKKP